MPTATAQKSADAYRSIGEAAREVDLPTHVLRYWETKFPRHVRPIKRPDGRRLYRKSDVDALRAIKTLVHRRGMTLKGAKALLQDAGVEIVLSGEHDLGAILAGSPVHELQRTVATAFSAERGAPVDPVLIDGARAEGAVPGGHEGMPDGSVAQPGIEIPDGEAGSPERLQAMLDGMDALKARLDAARSHRAA